MRHRASGELMSQHDVSPSQSHFSKVSSFSAMIEPPVTRRRSNDFSFSSIAEKIQISIKPDCSVALRRWTNTVYSKLPAVDKEAIQRNSNGLQAAAEFSQSAYNHMLESEKSTGNYLSQGNEQFRQFEANGGRQAMVLLIEELHSIKQYRELTFYFAVNIADRYLAKLVAKGASPPDIVCLGVTCLLIAAKMNEPLGPNFGNMVLLINQQNPDRLRIESLRSMEIDILLSLEFSLQAVTCLEFLERYCQLFRVDEGLTTWSAQSRGAAISNNASQFSSKVCQEALYLCKLTQQETEFLKYTPS